MQRRGWSSLLFYFHNSESGENMWLAEEDMFVWRICAQVENVFSARGRVCSGQEKNRSEVLSKPRSSPIPILLVGLASLFLPNTTHPIHLKNTVPLSNGSGRPKAMRSRIPYTVIYSRYDLAPRLRRSFQQCCGSMTFWFRSGSSLNSINQGFSY